MFNGLPTASRRLVKTALSLVWAFAGGAGLSSVLLTPSSFVRELGLIWTLIFGGVLTVAAAFAVFGVISGRYRWEWVASYLASASLVPYAMLLWAAVFSGRPSSAPQAFLVTALVACFVLRGFLCAAHAALLRKAYTAATTTVRTIDEGEGDADDTDRRG